MSEVNFTCSHCGEKKNDYANRDPYDGRRKICDDCFQESYMHDCALCDCSFSKEDSGLAIFFHECPGSFGEDDVKPGIYRILDYPIYCGSIIGGGWIESKNIQRIGDVPAGHTEQTNDNGHLCPECATRYGIDIKKFSMPVFNPDGTMKSPSQDTPHQWKLRKKAA